MRLFNNLINKKFGRLTVLEKTNERKNKKVIWLCKCTCGNVKTVRSTDLVSGNIVSCGCLQKELLKNGLSKKHGMSKTPTYETWFCMKNRCNNPKDARYKDYGGRGIKVCKKWYKFENFYEDMGVRPKNKTIDRINNNRGYEPSNCKWSTRAEQSNNMRSNRYICYKENIKTMSEWSRCLGIKLTTLRQRIKSGWSVEKMFNKKVRNKKRI